MSEQNTGLGISWAQTQGFGDEEEEEEGEAVNRSGARVRKMGSWKGGKRGKRG